MELHERFVSAVLGALWGLILGLLIALFLHYVVGSDFQSGFLILNWKNTIVGSSIICAILGLLFKANAGTIVGTLMSWVWSAIEYDRETSTLNWWIILIAAVAISYFFTSQRRVKRVADI
jgi:uncharacterized protein YacL